MPRTSKRAKLFLDEEKQTELQKIAQSRCAPLRKVQRANILLKYSKGTPLSTIEQEVHVSRPTIYKCIDKALAMGVDAGLKDKYHRPKDPVITEEAKMWVINLACTKPKHHGYAAEVWSRRLLAKHVRRCGPQEGHPCLGKAVKATIQRILKDQPLRPDKIAYYTERRDPEFEPKMAEVLLVYKEVKVQNERLQRNEFPSVITVSVDEKPGMQAIQNSAPDLLPDPNKNSRIMRDHEYKRLGTLSILASLDLHTGHVIAQVHERHRSREFVSLLKELDIYYPPECAIRIILDNHSAHISKETMEYLSTRPNRFSYVHTPKHGSWLNLVETLFGKMARTFLKHIRVNSINELKQRILKGIQEINESPVVHRWKKFEIAATY
ncbi:MAG: IS630 family transposase [Pseudomonadota bacterium]